MAAFTKLRPAKRQNQRPPGMTRPRRPATEQKPRGLPERTGKSVSEGECRCHGVKIIANMAEAAGFWRMIKEGGLVRTLKQVDGLSDIFTGKYNSGIYLNVAGNCSQIRLNASRPVNLATAVVETEGSYSLSCS